MVHWHFHFVIANILLYFAVFVQTRTNVGKLSNSIPRATASLTLCHNIPGLSRQQLNVCRRRGADTTAALEGLRRAVKECQHQFRAHRWNCSSINARTPLTNEFMNRGYRESAFVQAVTSAGVAHGVARACSQGRLVNCGCGAAGSGVSGRGWKWGGCSHDVQYGVEFARMFLDDKQLLGMADIRAIIAAHNNQAGRLAVANNMQTRCKCHGVSGSCELKTCWKTAPDFRRIGKILKNRFRSALLVDQSNFGNGSPIILTQKRRKERAKKLKSKRDISTELLFYQKSPNFCEKDPKIDVLGTTGRFCNRTSTSMDSCSSLCCGRGYNVVKSKRIERCNCKFEWCCQVKCENCIVEEWLTICK